MEKDKNLYNHSTKVMEHFLHPQNIGIIENATNVATAGNPEDGDVIRLFLLIQERTIVDAKVKVFGCPIAVASADILAELIKGKTIMEALRIKNEDISDALGGLPPQKLNCSVFAENLIKNALRGKK
ncbi:iron-sulfur cluster assembly scaffold protein [Dehalococcoidia bacterium]|nr:iron-sulfur cluster assembly scaffold protein [Dehalococcoidia bacterium]